MSEAHHGCRCAEAEWFKSTFVQIPAVVITASGDNFMKCSFYETTFKHKLEMT